MPLLYALPGRPYARGAAALSHRGRLVRQGDVRAEENRMGEHHDGGEHDLLAARFEDARPRLRAVAYRILGSAAEAEDAVQEA